MYIKLNNMGSFFSQSKNLKPPAKRFPPLTMIDTSLYSNKGLNCPLGENDSSRNPAYIWDSYDDCKRARDAQGYSMQTPRQIMNPRFRYDGGKKKTIRKNKKVRKTKSKK